MNLATFFSKSSTKFTVKGRQKVPGSGIEDLGRTAAAVDTEVGTEADIVAGTEVAEIEVADTAFADIEGLAAAAAAEQLRQLEIAAEDIVADIVDLLMEAAVVDIEAPAADTGAFVVDIEAHVADIEVVDIEAPAVDTEVALQWSPALSVAGAHCFRIKDGVVLGEQDP